MAELQKAFTSHKLNWLDCVASDRRLKPAAFKVAYAIMQHVNSETLVGWLSDETLVDITGISSAEVQRHRKSLKECGWLTWKRTGNANVYTPLFDQLPEGLEYILAKRAKRKELREARSAARNASLRLGDARAQRQCSPPPATGRSGAHTGRVVTPDPSPAMERVQSPAMDHDQSPAINIHLRQNTSDLTPAITIPSLRSGDASAKEADASRALKSDDDDPEPIRDHQPKAPYLQSDEAAKRAMIRLQELPFKTEWCGGLDEWGADFKPLSDSSGRAVKIYWRRLLREPIAAAEIVMVADRVLQRIPAHQRPSLAGFLARFEDYRPGARPRERAGPSPPPNPPGSRHFDHGDAGPG
jgi:hypothetical protein